MSLDSSTATIDWFSSSSSTGAGETEDEKETFLAEVTALAAGVLIICVGIAYYVKRKKWYWIPESVVAMILGGISGSIILAFRKHDAKKLIFDPQIFFFVLLPPIIFNAGYNMKRRNFFKYFSAIMVFAVPGTMIAISAIAFSLYYISQWGAMDIGNLTLVDAFIFATLIANVDPVATLSILGAINADKMLYSIVFGESMLNDAVSVVLFHTLKTVGSGLDITTKPMFELLGLFLGISLGTVALGIAIGLIACFFFKHANLNDHPPIETILILLFSYLSYVLPEILGLSGIMSLFFCGIVLAHYNWYNLSEAARATTRHGVEAGSFAAETAVYVYLGLNFAFSFGHVTDSLQWNWHFLLVTIVLCFISRALGVFLLSSIYNLFASKRRKIPFRMQVVIWWSGLRGSVAFALALNVPGDNTPVFITTTLATVMFTTVICGGMTERLVARLHLKAEPSHATIEPMMGGQLTEALKGEGEIMAWEDRSTSFVARWKRFEYSYMKQWFGGRHLDRVYKSNEVAEALIGGGEPYNPVSVTEDGLHIGSMPTMALSPIEPVSGIDIETPFLVDHPLDDVDDALDAAHAEAAAAAAAGPNEL